MSYKTELHCHTAECSGCANEDTVSTVEHYIRKGYTSLVITNHFFSNGGLTGPVPTHIRRCFEVFDLAREAAAGRLNIIPGMELSLDFDNRDYLLYGVTREFLEEHPDICTLAPDKVHELAKAKGMLLIAAHPMRDTCRIPLTSEVDGYERFNGHPKVESHNITCDRWCAALGDAGMIFTSGTDHHDTDHEPNAGILTEEPITNSEELVRVLRSGEYSLITCEHRMHE